MKRSGNISVLFLFAAILSFLFLAIPEANAQVDQRFIVRCDPNPATIEYGRATFFGQPYCLFLPNEAYDPDGAFKELPDLIRYRGNCIYQPLGMSRPRPSVIIGAHGNVGRLCGLGSPRQVGRAAAKLVNETARMYCVSPDDVDLYVVSCYAADNSQEIIEGLRSRGCNILPYVKPVRGSVMGHGGVFEKASDSPDWLACLPCDSPEGAGTVTINTPRGIPTPDCGDSPNLSITPDTPDTPPSVEAPRPGSGRNAGSLFDRYRSMLRGSSKGSAPSSGSRQKGLNNYVRGLAGQGYGTGWPGPQECMLIIDAVNGSGTPGNYNFVDGQTVYHPQWWPWNSDDYDYRPYYIDRETGEKVYVERGPDGKYRPI